MRAIVQSVHTELLRYKELAEGAIAQLADADLCARIPEGGNSIAVICRHVSGNLRSRFTDFLTSDGEKPWRNREGEFERRTVTRAELLANWEEGWQTALRTLAELSDDQLGRTVTIRGKSLTVHEALHRALAHTTYHVGQIVHMARFFRGQEWKFLSIPPGGSEAYNRAIR